MSKQSLLCEPDVSMYRLDATMMSNVRNLSQKLNLSPAEFRILDYGCGRGRAVARLRALGYDAYGVDVSSGPVSMGRPYFAEKGHDEEAVLQVINADGRASFPDGHFHFVFSLQVFEHVADLRVVCGEIARLTAQGGRGLHVFSAPRRLIEEHLLMPLVHWLPKGRLRLAWICCCQFVGCGPAWTELADKGILARARVYADYSNGKTFYRTWRTVAEAFGRCGMDCCPTVSERPHAHGAHGWLLRMARALNEGLYRRLSLTTLEIRLETMRR